jgi:hypothetical protein
VELRHCSEVSGEDFTVTGLQRCDEEIHGLFGSLVDFFPPSFGLRSVPFTQGVSESAGSAKRGWVQFGAKSGAVRNARASRGQAASTRERRSGEKTA